MYNLAMAFSVPQHSREEVNSAGDCLRVAASSILPLERDKVLDIINNWRASHSLPLQSFKMTLLSRAKKIDPKAGSAELCRAERHYSAAFRPRRLISMLRLSC
jgi:hypothetical protein